MYVDIWMMLTVSQHEQSILKIAEHNMLVGD